MITLTFYANRSGKYFLTKCQATEGETKVVLPPVLNVRGMRKTYGIGKYAFYHSPITELTLLDGVTNFDDYSFSYSKLQTVTILSNKAVTFGQNAFYAFQPTLKNIRLEVLQNLESTYHDLIPEIGQDVVEIFPLAADLIDENSLQPLYHAGQSVEVVILNEEIDTIGDGFYLNSGKNTLYGRTGMQFLDDSGENDDFYIPVENTTTPHTELDKTYGDTLINKQNKTILKGYTLFDSRVTASDTKDDFDTIASQAYFNNDYFEPYREPLDGENLFNNAYDESVSFDNNYIYFNITDQVRLYKKLYLTVDTYSTGITTLKYIQPERLYIDLLVTENGETSTIPIFYDSPVTFVPRRFYELDYNNYPRSAVYRLRVLLLSDQQEQALVRELFECTRIWLRKDSRANLFSTRYERYQSNYKQPNCFRVDITQALTDTSFTTTDLDSREFKIYVKQRPNVLTLPHDLTINLLQPMNDDSGFVGQAYLINEGKIGYSETVAVEILQKTFINGATAYLEIFSSGQYNEDTWNSIFDLISVHIEPSELSAYAEHSMLYDPKPSTIYAKNIKSFAFQNIQKQRYLNIEGLETLASNAFYGSKNLESIELTGSTIYEAQTITDTNLLSDILSKTTPIKYIDDDYTTYQYSLHDYFYNEHSETYDYYTALLEGAHYNTLKNIPYTAKIQLGVRITYCINSGDTPITATFYHTTLFDNITPESNIHTYVPKKSVILAQQPWQLLISNDKSKIVHDLQGTPASMTVCPFLEYTLPNGVSVATFNQYLYFHLSAGNKLTTPGHFNYIKRKADNRPIWFSNMSTVCVEKDKGNFYNEFLNNPKITEIPPYLFKDSRIYGELFIPKHITKIGRSAFENCSGLTKIICEERNDGSTLVIEDGAFNNCANISAVILPNTHSYIGYRALAVGGAFQGKKSNILLTTFTIPASITGQITEISKNAFTATSGNYISDIDIQERGVMLSKYQSNTQWLQYKEYIGKKRNVINIDPGIRTISAGWYSGLTSLTKVVIPASVTTIEDGAFKNCYALSEIEFENPEAEGTLTIGQNAFENCYGLYQVKLPKRLTAIKSKAFLNCYKIVEVSDPYGFIDKTKVFDDIDEQSGVGSTKLSSMAATIYGGLCMYLASSKNIIKSNTESSLQTIDNIVYYLGDLRTYYNLGYITGEKVTDKTTQEADWSEAGIMLLRTMIVPEFRNNENIIEHIWGRIENFPKLTTDVVTESTWQQWYTTYNEKADDFNKEDFKPVKYIVHVKNAATPSELIINPNIDTEYNYCLYPYFAYCNYNLEKLYLGEAITWIGPYAFADTLHMNEITLNGSPRTLSVELYWDGDETEFQNQVFRKCGTNTEGVRVIIGDRVKTITHYLFHPRHRWNNSTGYPKVISLSLLSAQDKDDTTKNDNWTTIEGRAFNQNLALRSVTLGNNLQYIASNAFANCPMICEVINLSTNSALEKTDGYKTLIANALSISKSESAQSEALILNDYFALMHNDAGEYILVAYDGKLINVTLPTLTNTYAIADNVFLNRTDIQHIDFNDAVHTIGQHACQNTSIVNLVLPKNLTLLKNQAFYDNKKLNSINWDALDNNQLTIGNDAFRECKLLTTVPNLNKVKKLGQQCFYACSNMTGSLNFPNHNITLEGHSQFMGTNITNIGNFGGLTTISQQCFKLTGITSLDFNGSKVETIVTAAFEECVNLQSVYLSSLITNLGARAFAGCRSLKKIEVDEANPNYMADDTGLYTKDQTALIQLCLGNTDLTIYEVPLTVTEIRANACSYANNRLGSMHLTTVAWSRDHNGNAAITTIGNNAFQNQKGLTQFIIPSSVETLGENIFANCGSQLKILCENTQEEVLQQKTNWNSKWTTGVANNIYYYKKYDVNNLPGETEKCWYYDDNRNPSFDYSIK